MVQKILVIGSYILAAIIVVGGTFLLIAYGSGYSYDIKTHKIVHRGLLILDSTPGGADIGIEGKSVHDHTPYRKTLEEGSYQVSLTRKGYHTWTNKVKIVPSQASLTQYIIMLPNELKTAAFGAFDHIGQTLASEDHHRLAFVIPTGAKAGVWSLDTQSGQSHQIYISAAASDTKPAETVELVQWSDDNSHVLVRSRVGDANSLLVLDEDGSDEPINITTVFGVAPAALSFNPSNWRQLYWYNAGTLTRLDIDTKTASSTLADHVLGYAFAGDRIVYVSSNGTLASLWSLDSNGRKQELVHSVPLSSAYELAYATYIRTAQVAVVALDSHQVTLYSDVYDKPTATTLPAAASHALFNGDGRFLLQSDDMHVATYDLQERTTYTFPASTTPITGLSWFDTYHLLYTSGAKVYLSEFDGNYALPLSAADALPALSTPNDKSVLVTMPTPSGGTQIKTITIRQ